MCRNALLSRDNAGSRCNTGVPRYARESALLQLLESEISGVLIEQEWLSPSRCCASANKVNPKDHPRSIAPLENPQNLLRDEVQKLKNFGSGQRGQSMLFRG